MPNLPEPTTMTINFDSHVIKVTSTGIADYEWTTSGQSVDVGGYGGTTYYATVTLEDGYEIASVTSTDSDYNLLTFSGNIISFRTEYSGMGSGFTITTKAAAAKQTIDVSTLSGWANLATGNHQITIKTKASGYVDSAASNAVTVSKAASGYSVSVATYEGNGDQSYEYSTDNGVTWNAITGEGLIVESATQIKFRVTGTVEAAEASILSVLLDMNIQFSSPGDAVGTWRYSENYTLTQNIDDILCRAAL